MKLCFFCLTIIIFGHIACQKINSHPNEDVRSLRNRFQGKYKAITSTSDEAADINLDGNASTDMLVEMTNFAGAELVIHIIDKRNFIFYQLWPEQYFNSRLNPVTYDSTVRVDFAVQGAVRLFTFDHDVKQIFVSPNEAPLPDSLHFTIPKLVTIEANDRIQVISIKQLYTRSGWKKIEITTTYERYTKET